jgi:hypothetical protein
MRALEWLVTFGRSRAGNPGEGRVRMRRIGKPAAAEPFMMG